MIITSKPSEDHQAKRHASVVTGNDHCMHILGAYFVIKCGFKITTAFNIAEYASNLEILTYRQSSKRYLNYPSRNEKKNRIQPSVNLSPQVVSVNDHCSVA